MRVGNYGTVRGMNYPTIEDAIGRTPLVRLRKLAEGIPARVYVKVEAINPGGSIKDRVGLSMVEEAERLGVTGWVRNRRNGDVEAVVQAAPEAVQAIIAWAKRGPSHAIVDHVQVDEATGDFSRFEMRPTA